MKFTLTIEATVAEGPWDPENVRAEFPHSIDMMLVNYGQDDTTFEHNAITDWTVTVRDEKGDEVDW